MGLSVLCGLRRTNELDLANIVAWEILSENRLLINLSCKLCGNLWDNGPSVLKGHLGRRGGGGCHVGWEKIFAPLLK